MSSGLCIRDLLLFKHGILHAVSEPWLRPAVASLDGMIVFVLIIISWPLMHFYSDCKVIVVLMHAPVKIMMYICDGESRAFMCLSLCCEILVFQAGSKG